MTDNEELLLTAETMTKLISLIQEYPAEARRIMAAVDDGLTLGPAQVMPREWEPPNGWITTWG